MSSVVTPPLVVTPPEEVREIVFDKAMNGQIERILKRYPSKRPALLPVLWLCQERWGWISPGMVTAIGERLDLAPAFIEGVVTFYTMYQRTPPGRYLVQVCTTLSCQLCGTSWLVEHLNEKLGIGFGETTADGNFTLLDVQCLGACGEAPVIQINNDYYTDLTVEKVDRILDALAEA